ncbi:MAG: NAD(P)H-dependent glycerol-3-phosphate dehydrogenase [Minisyncoccota bacterium]
MENKKIAIIGYGELGRAIHRSLRNKLDLIIETWDKKDQESKLKGVVSSSEVIFLCVPSWCARVALENIKNYLSKKALVVCLSKGIEDGTFKTVDQILEEVFDSRQAFAILSGPMLAEELASNKMGFAVLASKKKKDSLVVSDIFSKTNLKVKYSNDLRGVALCGVLKNIYSLGLGICDGLNLGGNTKGKLTLEAIKEMSEIIVYLGGKKASVFSEAGIGDLISTAFSNFSRNREVGETLAKTGICCLESEGYKSVESLINLLDKKYLELPFLAAIKKIVLDNKKPADSFADLISNENI